MDEPPRTITQQLLLQHGDILQRAATLPLNDAVELLNTHIQAARERTEPYQSERWWYNCIRASLSLLASIPLLFCGAITDDVTRARMAATLFSVSVACWFMTWPSRDGRSSGSMASYILIARC